MKLTKARTWERKRFIETSQVAEFVLLNSPLDSIVQSLRTGLKILNSEHKFSTVLRAFFSDGDRTVIFKVLADLTDSTSE